MATSLSPLEGHLLASIWRYQPTTAHFVRRSFERGLSTNLSSSPGGVYPALKRLEARKLVTIRPAENDGRKTGLLSITSEGLGALKEWLADLPASALLLEDPLRTRIAFADLFERSEYLQWLSAARRKLGITLHELTEAMRIEQPPLTKLAYENARAQTQARLSWIDLAIAECAAGPDDQLPERTA